MARRLARQNPIREFIAEALPKSALAPLWTEATAAAREGRIPAPEVLAELGFEPDEFVRFAQVLARRAD